MSTEWDHPHLTKEQFARRLHELAREDVVAQAEYLARGEELPFYWLSFADEHQFLGGCYVQAATPVAAIQRAGELGINPGGEVLMAGPIKASTMDEDFRSGWCNRLLSKAEAEDIPHD